MTATHPDDAQRQTDRAISRSANISRAASVGQRRRVPLLRLAIVVGTLALFAVASRFGDPTASLAADPDLARLLRGMAAIKALLVAAAVAILMWRVARPLARRAFAGYVVGIVLMTTATALIWRLSAIVPAALTFHVGVVLMLVVAWRDDGAFVRLRRGRVR